MDTCAGEATLKNVLGFFSQIGSTLRKEFSSPGQRHVYRDKSILRYHYFVCPVDEANPVTYAIFETASDRCKLNVKISPCISSFIIS